ncbi:hypothetical protein Tsubulata_030468, partial [Turnera subulata]
PFPLPPLSPDREDTSDSPLPLPPLYPGCEGVDPKYYKKLHQYLKGVPLGDKFATPPPDYYKNYRESLIGLNRSARKPEAGEILPPPPPLPQQHPFQMSPNVYKSYDEDRSAGAGPPRYTRENPHPRYVLQQEVIQEAKERLAARPPGDPGAFEDRRMIKMFSSPFDNNPHMDLEAYSKPWTIKPSRPEIACPIEISRKMDWEKFYSEWGSDYALGASFDVRRYVEEGDPRYRPEVFMEASKMAVEFYNRTHLGSEIELVEPVGGKILMFPHHGWEHFNFRAKSKTPDAADQSVHLFFGERYLGKRELGPNGFPHGCVGEPQITQCTDLTFRDTKHPPGGNVDSNSCRHGCHRLDNIIHPFQWQGFLHNPSNMVRQNHPPGV